MAKKTYMEMVQRRQAIGARIGEMADILAKENRSRTTEEEEEFENLRVEDQLLEMQCRAIETQFNIEKERKSPVMSRSMVMGKILRGMASANHLIPEDFSYVRNQDGSLLIPESVDAFMQMRTDTNLINTAGVEPIVPITVKDLIEPLEKGLILDKVGLKLQTGISGVWNYPTVEAVEAEWEGENDSVSDKKLTLGKISPSPKRLSISIPVSNRAIWQSSSEIVNIVKTQAVAGITRKLNKTMFDLEAPSAEDAAKIPAGCFANVLAANKVTKVGHVTYADINNLRAAVEKSGVQLANPAFVVSTSQYYALKSTQRGDGLGFIIGVDGTIDGVPVFRTEYVGEDFIGYGVFGYELLGQFGPMSMNIDSNSHEASAKNVTWFVLNGDWDMKTLENKGFGYITVTSE